MKLNKKQIKIVIDYFLKKFQFSKQWKFKIIINDKVKKSAEIQYWLNKKKFKITINPKRQYNTKELIDTILHELLHLILAPYTNLIEDLIEYPKLYKWDNKEKVAKMLEIEETIVRKLTKSLLRED
jgi:hypothetical protein